MNDSTTNPFQYTDTELDPETNPYYYRARYYDPSTGRFISEDPIKFGGGVDFYEYVFNSPVDSRDETGLCPPPRPCFAQLKYRPVHDVPGANHAFWYLLDATGTYWIVDGGPTGQSTGSLNVWAQPGNVGHYPADNSEAPTWWSSPVSPESCAGVLELLIAAQKWPENTIPYWGYPGPNSNSTARQLGIDGGFSPSQPPNTPGWDHSVP